MGRPVLRRLPLVCMTASLLGAGAACSREATPPAAPPSHVVIRVSNAGTPEPPAAAPFITVDVDAGVRYESRGMSAEPGEWLQDTTINGLRLLWDGQELLIGPARSGPLAPGDHVVIAPTGIHVNGERRAALPQ